MKKEEKKVKVPKFTRPDVVEELTKDNIKDIITGQEMEIKNLEREIKMKKNCIKYYSGYLTK